VNPSPGPGPAPDARPPGGPGEATGLSPTDWPARWRQAEGCQGIGSEWLCRLLEEGPQPFAAIDLERRIIWSNRAFSDLVGYAREELLGMSILDLTAPQSRDVTRRYQADVLATGKAERVIKNYRRKDGSLVPVELVIDVLRDDSGVPLGLYAFITDISERARAEEAVVVSERRTRALFDGIHDAVFVHDQEGKILDANPAACRQLGYTREEMLGMTTDQIDAPEFAAGFRERLERQLRQGVLSCEGMHRTKGGKTIPVEVTATTIQYDSQIAVLAVLRDITERKALERTRREFAEAQTRNAREMEQKNQALSESEARYRQLAEGSLDAIVVADGQGRITLFNPSAEKIFGYSSSEVLDQPLARLVPGILAARGPESPDDGEGPASSHSMRAEADQPAPSGRHGPPELSSLAGRTVELTGRKRDGTEFPLELSLSAVEMNGGPQYVGSIRDQTERRRMHAMLAQSDKLASIGLLSAGVAHEINNPLAYVANNLVVLERDFKGLIELVGRYESARGVLQAADPELVRRIDELAEEIDWPYIRDNDGRILDRTRSGVKRVAGIIEKMRGLARTTPPKWETVSLSDLVEGAVELMRGRLKQQGVEVSVSLRDVTRIRCVPDQIGQVLLNLLINALQAIEGAGRTDGRIEVEARHEGPWVAVEVGDNGTGIDPEHRRRLFDPFFTTKPVGEGTGLGLAISHGIITGHGGRIEVDTRPGEGTRFRILLPQSHAGGTPPRPDSPRPPPVPHDPTTLSC
jgi:two-component system NtrC family sensor kinase